MFGCVRPRGGHVGWFAKCRGVTPESFEIVLPLVFLSSVDFFRTRFGARHGPVLVHQVQWSLKPEHAQCGAITGKDVIMDLSIENRVPVRPSDGRLLGNSNLLLKLLYDIPRKVKPNWRVRFWRRCGRQMRRMFKKQPQA